MFAPKLPYITCDPDDDDDDDWEDCPDPSPPPSYARLFVEGLIVAGATVLVERVVAWVEQRLTKDDPE